MKMIIAENIKNLLTTIDDAQTFLKNNDKEFRLAYKSLVETLMAKLTTMKYNRVKEM